MNFWIAHTPDRWVWCMAIGMAFVVDLYFFVGSGMPQVRIFTCFRGIKRASVILVVNQLRKKRETMKWQQKRIRRKSS